jgi:hypothetical protein
MQARQVPRRKKNHVALSAVQTAFTLIRVYLLLVVPREEKT